MSWVTWVRDSDRVGVARLVGQVSADIAALGSALRKWLETQCPVEAEASGDVRLLTDQGRRDPCRGLPSGRSSRPNRAERGQAQIPHKQKPRPHRTGAPCPHRSDMGRAEGAKSTHINASALIDGKAPVSPGGRGQRSIGAPRQYRTGLW
jgi:hypothetical protein